MVMRRQQGTATKCRQIPNQLLLKRLLHGVLFNLDRQPHGRSVILPGNYRLSLSAWALSKPFPVSVIYRLSSVHCTYPWAGLPQAAVTVLQ
jgi:hypothetical protein